jgi:hypothetical protein
MTLQVALAQREIKPFLVYNNLTPLGMQLAQMGGHEGR